jgi:spermidine synthase
MGLFGYNPAVNDSLYRRALAGLFFVSGFAALLYQTVWIHRLSLQFGHSAWAVSTVIAVFMAGLGLGGWLAGRISDGLRAPIRVYAGIEAGVAICGLVSWPLLRSLPLTLAPFYGVPFVFPTLRLAICFLVLLTPTVLMGASLPILVAASAERGPFAKTVGFFYGFNTLGSALGALAAIFFLVPVFGVRFTVAFAALLGFAVSAGALFVSSRAPAFTETPVSEAPAPRRVSRGVLLLALACGFYGLFLEIAWTRLLAPILGSSIYTFCLILFVYLCGTGAGSLYIARRPPPSERSLAMACVSLAAAALMGLVGLPLVNVLPRMFITLAPLTLKAPALFYVVQTLVVALLVLLPTVALGMALPCLVSGHRGASNVGGPSLGRVYAFNTMGAIAGCFMTGFWFLPTIGVSTAVIRVSALALAVAALFFCACGPALLRQRVLGSLVALALAGAAALWWPRVNMRQLQTGYFRSAMKTTARAAPHGDLLFVRDGVSSTIAVYRTPEQTALKVNGKTDASTGGDVGTQLLLGHLPMIFHPHPKRVCVIGYGSGATVRAVVTHSPRSVDVVELEPAVIAASPYFRSVNDSVLDDPSVRLHIEDGRTFLTYGKGTFDVIVSEPSNPWIAGVGSLFSREFYRHVEKRLSPGGVFCQWIQTYELSRPTLNVMIQTLAETFPNVSIFVVGSDFICVASNGPLAATSATLAQRMSAPEVKRNLAKIGIETPFDLLLGYYASLPDDLDRYPSTVRNTDDNSWLETRAPTEMYLGRLPQLEIPSIPIVFDRYARRFFPDVSKDRLALGLAASVAKLRPFAAFRISEMVPLFKKSPTVTRLDHLAQIATARATVMRSADHIMLDAVQKIRDGRLKEARSSLLPLVAADPHEPGIQRLLGIIAARTKQSDAAMRYFTAALEDNPADFETLTEMGELRLAESNVPAAIACFSRALEADPQAPRARLLMKQLMGPTGHS